MKYSDYPAIYINADGASANRQSVYFRSLIIQYLLLILASAITVSNPWLDGKISSAIYLLLMLVAAALAFYVILKRPEKEWYRARAMAESVKTLTWRFSMCAEPFQKSLGEYEAEKRFGELLSELIDVNRVGTEELSYNMSHGKQVTESMRNIRMSTLEEKRKVYLDSRIQNQLDWYIAKANRNKTLSTVFSYFTIVVYILAIALAAAQYENLILNFQWLSEPLLVVAASLIGWMQAKRFSELSTSYNITAHEINRIRDSLIHLEDVESYSSFVAEAEFAFSREHTQWTARQISGV